MIYLLLQDINSFSLLIWIKKEQKKQQTPPQKRIKQGKQ